MRDNQWLAELSRRLSEVIPAAEHLREDMRTKIEQTLKSGLRDLDVLSREEFAAQEQALARAQQRVLELETRIQTLEQRLDQMSTGSTGQGSH